MKARASPRQIIVPAVFKRCSVSFQAEIINLEIQSIVIDGTLLLSPSVSTVTGVPKARTPTRPAQAASRLPSHRVPALHRPKHLTLLSGERATFTSFLPYSILFCFFSLKISKTTPQMCTPLFRAPNVKALSHPTPLSSSTFFTDGLTWRITVLPSFHPLLGQAPRTTMLRQSSSLQGKASKGCRKDGHLCILRLVAAPGARVPTISGQLNTLSQHANNHLSRPHSGSFQTSFNLDIWLCL